MKYIVGVLFHYISHSDVQMIYQVIFEVNSLLDKTHH